MNEHRATGTFDVTLTPSDPASLGGMKIDKVFHGELTGTSVGQMLSARYPDGSGGYVAMEKVTATLGSQHGSFMLQHSGTMNRGAQTLSVTVVPDSGTEGLTGLSGTMDILVSPSRHEYRFTYRLPGR